MLRCGHFFLNSDMVFLKIFGGADCWYNAWRRLSSSRRRHYLLYTHQITTVIIINQFNIFYRHITWYQYLRAVFELKTTIRKLQWASGLSSALGRHASHARHARSKFPILILFARTLLFVSVSHLLDWLLAWERVQVGDWLTVIDWWWWWKKKGKNKNGFGFSKRNKQFSSHLLAFI